MDSEDESNSHSPVSIENEIDFEKHQNFIERYFIQKFQINAAEHNDICVLVHSNRLCVIALAPSHPVVCDKIKIEKINFQISKNTNRLENKTSGKRKRNAQTLVKGAPICFIECANGKRYTISTPVPGKLLEVNDQLPTSPEVLQFSFQDNYFKQCYIAIILPNYKIPIEDLTKDLISLDEYQEAISNRIYEF